MSLEIGMAGRNRGGVVFVERNTNETNKRTEHMGQVYRDGDCSQPAVPYREPSLLLDS